VLEPTSAENKGLIMQTIDSLYSEGATNAEEGLQLGYRLAAEHAQPERITRIILCSDGVANVGNTGPDSILRTIRSYVDQDVTLSTVGFGMDNFNDVLMEQLANDGDGNYYYVDTLNEARRVFVENLTGTLQVIAKDAKVQVDFDPAVVSRYRLLGYENRAVRDEQFRDDTVDAGEVGAGHSVTALYEVKFHDAAAGPAATVYIRYQDPDTGEVIEQSAALAREDFRPTFAEMAPRFQLDAAVAEYAEILRNSYWAQDGSLSAVRQLAQQVSAALPDDADVTEFAFLVSQAERIQQRQ
jgi:Ca-activated chloride channel family protein